MSAPTLPDVSSRYGAPQGRRDRPSLHPQVSRKFNLVRVRIDRGGYDSGGAYWGLGPPLYWATCQTGSIDFFFRAIDRDAAKTEVLRRHPGARFFR